MALCSKQDTVYRGNPENLKEREGRADVPIINVLHTGFCSSHTKYCCSHTYITFWLNAGLSYTCLKVMGDPQRLLRKPPLSTGALIYYQLYVISMLRRLIKTGRPIIFAPRLSRWAVYTWQSISSTPSCCNTFT